MCKYDLAGLPLAHRCPECGFVYDEHTQVWRMSPLMWRFGQASMLVALGSGVAAEIFLFVKIGSLRWTPLRPATIALVFIVAMALRHLYSGSPMKWFVCTAPEGVMLRLRGSKVVVVPWCEVRKVIVRLGVPSKAVFLATTDGAKHRLEGFISGKQRTHDFQRCIAEGKRRYWSQPAAASIESDE